MPTAKTDPILITGAGGGVGSVSPTIVRLLLEDGWPVRALVRTDDHRAASLRKAGAEVFVGDLLNVADVAVALRGCRRVYFSMSLSPYYVDANLLMAAAARAQGDVEVFVNMSESEQTNLTFDRMTASEDDRASWFGGRALQWSPQHRAHWIGEQALNWSGLPVIHLRAGIFVENPILSWFPIPDAISTGELRLPFGDRKLAPIAGYDVAEVCANILRDPAAHPANAYTLIGPELKGVADFADDYAAALRRPVAYAPQDLETWNAANIDALMAGSDPHIGEHLKTLTRLVASGRYYDDLANDDLGDLLGRPPKTLRWALEHHSHVQDQVRAVRA